MARYPGRRAAAIEHIVDTMKHFPEQDGKWCHELMAVLMSKASQRKGTPGSNLKDRPQPYGQWLLLPEGGWTVIQGNQGVASPDIRPKNQRFLGHLHYRPKGSSTRQPAGAIIDVLLHYYEKDYLPLIHVPLHDDDRFVEDLPAGYLHQFGGCPPELGEIVSPGIVKMTLLHYFLWRVLAVAVRQEALAVGDRHSTYWYNQVITNLADTFLPIKTDKSVDDEFVMPLAELFIGVVGAMWLDTPRTEPKTEHLKGLIEVLASMHMFFTSRRKVNSSDSGYYEFIQLRKQTTEYDAREPQRYVFAPVCLPPSHPPSLPPCLPMFVCFSLRKFKDNAELELQSFCQTVLLCMLQNVISTVYSMPFCASVF